MSVCDSYTPRLRLTLRLNHVEMPQVPGGGDPSWQTAGTVGKAACARHRISNGRMYSVLRTEEEPFQESGEHDFNLIDSASVHRKVLLKKRGWKRLLLGCIAPNSKRFVSARQEHVTSAFRNRPSLGRPKLTACKARGPLRAPPNGLQCPSNPPPGILQTTLNSPHFPSLGGTPPPKNARLYGVLTHPRRNALPRACAPPTIGAVLTRSITWISIKPSSAFRCFLLDLLPP